MDIVKTAIINFPFFLFYKTIILESYIFFKTASYFVLTVNYFVIFDFKKRFMSKRLRKPIKKERFL
jgi:hypothetical protein